MLIILIKKKTKLKYFVQKEGGFYSLIENRVEVSSNYTILEVIVSF